MKAEHRKELHTNLLADRMGRLVQGVKAGPGPKSAIVWVIVGLACVTGIGWYWANRARDRSGEAWVAFNKSTNPNTYPEIQLSELKNLATNNPGTIAGRTARFQRARLLLGGGLKSVYSAAGSLPALQAHERSREQAVKDLEEARTLYRQLMPECSEDPVLEPEAMIGAAKTEEALAGIPKADNPDVGLGSLDEALKLYRKLADSPEYGRSAWGLEASQRCQEFDTRRADIDQFYAGFRAEVAKRSAPAKVP
jgi:hypothetical protein